MTSFAKILRAIRTSGFWVQMEEYERFVQLHRPQLDRVPRHLWQGLHYKLQAEVYDAGEYFMLSPGRAKWSVVVTHRGKLAANDANSVFLVDHAWTFQPHLVARQLQSVPGLAGRMAALMDLDGFPCLSGEEADSEDLSEEEAEEEIESDEKQGSDGKPTEQPVPTEAPVTSTPSSPPPPPPSRFLPTLSPSHRAAVRSNISGSDSSSSSSSSGSGGEEGRRRPAAVLPPPVRGGSGYDSLSGYESYAGYESCDVEEEEGEEEEEAREGERVEEEENQHAGVEVCQQLTNQMVVPSETPPTEELVARIQEAMWRFCHPYSINNSQVPVWYIMDEFGSRIPHSERPTVALTSFFYLPRQLAYCVFWPLRDLKFADVVTRDYLCNIGSDITGSPLQRACHLIPWSHDSHMTSDDPRWQELPRCTVPPANERCNEDLPDPSLPHSSSVPPYTVYSDIDLVRKFLKHPSFKLIDEKEVVDIIWCHDHFKQFSSLRDGQVVNQFPCENVLTCKDLLVQTAKRVSPLSGNSPAQNKVGGVGWAGPKWLPVTYNLVYELPHLVKHYNSLENSDEPNVWIIKPWNLGRGIDIHVTSSLHQMIRLAQAGPKIASRYITDPVLFQRPETGRVKFDIRYVVLLRSVDPFEAYVYNVFWLRFSNRPFSLDDFYNYEKHFTVMNYQKGAELKQIHCHEFIPLFEEQYPDHSWAEIEISIFQMFSDLMKAACSAPPPAGLAPSKQCRAIYAADLMLEWNRDNASCPRMEPRLLEMNFCPDCTRACRYHPDFFNHVFEVLFLDHPEWTQDLPVTRLK